MQDIRWLGFEPNGGIFYGSDYFDKCYEYAEKLIMDGKAYVDDLTREEMQEYRGNDAGKPSRPSPYRDRSVEENLDLFRRMRAGEFEDGAKTLRAKIDLASPNMNMRDPAIYRIKHVSHHRQGDKWCIYPLYDFAHPIQDALEGITYSCCSIEFADHRPLYDWVVENVGFKNPRPHQYEFARLNVTHTVMSKLYLRMLVETGVVDGWDDPRMPTLSGMRRRGYTPSSIIEFIKTAGVSKAYSIVDVELLEHCIRDELNRTAQRRMAVIDPVKVVVLNYPEDKTEYFEVANNVNDPEAGTRKVEFSRELYIEREDFAAVPPPKFFRMKPEGEVRLMGAYIVKCVGYETDETGKVTEIAVTADLETGNAMPADGRKIKGTVHWVSAKSAVTADVRMYGRLFSEANMVTLPEGKDYNDFLDPDSVKEYKGAKLEASLGEAGENERFQFVRSGYFIRDSKNPGVWNNIVNLKDSWAKQK